MQNFVCKLMIASLLFCLVSCTTGQKIDVALVKREIIVNQSTVEDVLRVCGLPRGKMLTSDNSREVWHYVYLKKEVTGLGVLAHVANVGTETQSEQVILDVTLEKDVVVDYKISEGSMKSMHFKL